jgi:competence protein ComEA
VSEPQPHGPVDERSLAALEALRREPSPGRPADGELVRPWWVDRAREMVVARWPAVVERPGGVVVAVAVGLVVLVGLVLWVTGVVGGGSTAAQGPPLSLPFTTAVDGTGDVLGPGGTAGAPTTTTAVVVHAAGAVVRPGVHRLPGGSRVADVLAAAGGPGPDADLDRVNLAALVADGQRLYVPRLGEAAVPAPVGAADGAGTAGAAGGGTSPTAGGPVDLNAATESELDVLPGVGPSTASAIVAHREANGPFSRVDDLLEVRGIGPAKLEALRDLVTVG